MGSALIWFDFFCTLRPHLCIHICMFVFVYLNLNGFGWTCGMFVATQKPIFEPGGAVVNLLLNYGGAASPLTQIQIRKTLSLQGMEMLL